MDLLAVSKDKVRAHVIQYFHDVFGDPISSFKPTTDVAQGLFLYGRCLEPASPTS